MQRKEDVQEEVEDEIDDDDADCAPALLKWRTAVANSTSAAQLTLCLCRLTNSIAWEKSIMKVVRAIFVKITLL